MEKGAAVKKKCGKWLRRNENCSIRTSVLVRSEDDIHAASDDDLLETHPHKRGNRVAVIVIVLLKGRKWGEG